MTALPQAFLTAPIAHRGLHGAGVPENSLAAARAAIDAGYGIELDIQPASDGTPMVFHDDFLTRLTGQSGLISETPLQAVQGFRLLGSDEPVPTLAEFLEVVAGQVPLLIEIKDQDGACGPDIGDLQLQVAKALETYQGDVAMMSFNPHTVAAFHEAAPHIAVGLTTCDYRAKHWPLVPDERRAELSAILDFDRCGASFISHDRNTLDNPRVDALAAQGVPVLCWTVRSAEEEAAARRVASNITFEGYSAAI
ncbi:glycerophosphodiester phosphodiesterase family protein [Paracoccus sp. JM45]|uniref:glycerophosphodiester phosphodiesterase family protein n=1 Tax=Paracoccus sp. JM45 TaxID=2283626 RepID=UPI000E6C04CE|nr:glycerophosphodiester phosphodiesterase family protein [Paracoccus sp. JM45]RJE80503.1 phosphodiesterase [Paracoccus sp. JM45]